MNFNEKKRERNNDRFAYSNRKEIINFFGDICVKKTLNYFAILFEAKAKQGIIYVNKMTEIESIL